ncbi:MAG: MBL fold metallo-hydrolase [Oscillospiraceae bacterium]|nr:MBL fold metallo-hydrolase [Oscillospiraceae bacterium]
MKITFLGADHEVTGSCMLLEVGESNFLVDCGMEQGKDLFVNAELPVSAKDIDFVLLTHAHIDHSGRLPLLYKQGFRGQIYASAATCSLCDIMLRDCANIQMTEAEWQGRKARRAGERENEPLFDMDDALGAIGCLRGCAYGERIQIDRDVAIRMTDVGHLLGSAAIEVWLSEAGETRKIVFSGDVGNLGQPLLRDPQFVEDGDYLVIESTYGDRLHDAERPDYVKELASRIQATLDRGGNMIVPSFAVGRTQEILYFIREIKERGLVTGHGDFPVYVDSPLAIEATSVFQQCDTQFLDEDTQRMIRAGRDPLRVSGLQLTISDLESKAINNDKTPKVILSASGMCDAGRVRHHLKHNLWRPECTVLFVGYQAAGTLGRILVDGTDKVKLFGEEIAVKAQIDVLPGVSGHADKEGLLRWLGGFREKPKMVFVQHGDPDSCDSFTKCLKEEHGYQAYAPYSGCSFDLLHGQFLAMPEGVPVERKSGTGRRVSPAFARLIAAAERLLAACRKLEGHANKELAGHADRIEKLAERVERDV